MSVEFDRPPNDAARRLIDALIGENTPRDDRTFLADIKEIDNRTMRDIANAAGQPVTVALHAMGEIKTLADGSRYEVTADGWKRLPDAA